MWPFKKPEKSDLIIEAINAKYKAKAEEQQRLIDITLKAIRQILGWKYVSQAQIIDGKVYLMGVHIYCTHYSWEKCETDLYVTDFTHKIRCLADFGAHLEKKYSVDLI